MVSIIKVGTAILMSNHHSSPAKFFKWLAYISDRYVLPVWVGFLDKKNSLKTGIKLSTEEVKADLKVKDV